MRGSVTADDEKTVTVAKESSTNRLSGAEMKVLGYERRPRPRPTCLQTCGGRRTGCREGEDGRQGRGRRPSRIAGGVQGA